MRLWRESADRNSQRRRNEIDEMKRKQERLNMDMKKMILQKVREQEEIIRSLK